MPSPMVASPQSWNSCFGERPTHWKQPGADCHWIWATREARAPWGKLERRGSILWKHGVPTIGCLGFTSGRGWAKSYIYIYTYQDLPSTSTGPTIPRSRLQWWVPWKTAVVCCPSLAPPGTGQRCCGKGHGAEMLTIYVLYSLLSSLLTYEFYDILLTPRLLRPSLTWFLVTTRLNLVFGRCPWLWI